MTKNATAKKPVLQEDWHPADVIAALHKRNWSLQQLAVVNGYNSRTAIAHALRKPYPKAERIIAAALDMLPQDIWPSRYNADGTTNRTPGYKPMRPDHIRIVGESTPAKRGRNLQDRQGQ